MKSTFAYIRVSTQKQGQLGVSLQEQRAAIERYAHKQGLSVTRWFEERETAAKRGRPVFAQMLKDLRSGKAGGVIMHKIDRSARNLRDWADLRELADGGIEAHFASEGLDLQTRDRRLSADVQAVVAAAYIDNLREEAKKGFYGRLKQGVFPLAAPIGYLDKGAGKPKEPHPVAAPLVRKAFELYATGQYTLSTLQPELHSLGLRNRRGGTVTRSGLAKTLRNPFYIGLIRISKTNETFHGAHRPIISPQLFQHVQEILSGRGPIVTTRHEFLFRQLLQCRHCGYGLVGDLKKGRVYYRCWRSDCISNSIREDRIEHTVLETLATIQLLPDELAQLRTALERIQNDRDRVEHDLRSALELQVANLKVRKDRLLDAYMDNIIDQDTLSRRRGELLTEEAALAHKLKEFDEHPPTNPPRLDRYFELLKSAHSMYFSASVEEKRRLLADVTSNFIVSGKNVEIKMKSPFRLLANRQKDQSVDYIGTHFELLGRDLIRLSYDPSPRPSTSVYSVAPHSIDPNS